MQSDTKPTRALSRFHEKFSNYFVKMPPCRFCVANGREQKWIQFPNVFVEHESSMKVRTLNFSFLYITCFTCGLAERFYLPTVAIALGYSVPQFRSELEEFERLLKAEGEKLRAEALKKAATDLASAETKNQVN